MQLDHKIISNKVFTYIKHELNYEGEITMDKKLTSDLSLDGSEAIFFIEDFANHFSLDTSNFEITKYFACEGLFSYLKNFPKYLIEKKLSNRDTELRVGDLVEAVRKGKLDI